MTKTIHIPKRYQESAEELKKKAADNIKISRALSVTLSIIFIFTLIAVVAVLYVNSTGNFPDFLAGFRNTNNQIFAQNINPAAIVNGEEISMQELNDRYALIPPEYTGFIDKKEVLSQMIDEVLLLQQAKTMGITASSQEIDDQINSLLDQNQLTMADFERTLQSRNISLESFRDYTSKEIILNKLINSTVMKNISVTPSDIQDYYQVNIEQYLVPESVNVSHILICHNESISCVSNITIEEALQKAQMISSLVNQTNFDELAREYSDEPAAQYTNGNLGWVSMQDPIDSTFLNATFSLKVGEISKPVKTMFGYHLIKVFAQRPEQQLTLDEVREQINQTLSGEKSQQAFLDYLESLRIQAQIINYVDTNQTQI
jgi:parvulin-like peptidyl-prolyl isomerase